MVGVWLIVLASSLTLYGKGPRLILKKTSRLTQAVVSFRRHFLCGALMRNCSSAEREGLSTHVQWECSAEPLYAQHLVTKNLHISPRFLPTIFDPDANSVFLRAYLCTAVDSLRRNPCVRNCSREREGLYTGNVQQNPLCAASCVTKNLHISPWFSPTIFYRDANPVLLLGHFCTAAVLLGSMRRT